MSRRRIRGLGPSATASSPGESHAKPRPKAPARRPSPFSRLLILVACIAVGAIAGFLLVFIYQTAIQNAEVPPASRLYSGQLQQPAAGQLPSPTAAVAATRLAAFGETRSII